DPNKINFFNSAQRGRQGIGQIETLILSRSFCVSSSHDGRQKEAFMKNNVQSIGYLPDERPPLGRLILYAVQHVIVMFPATVAVAIITGFHISTTIFASGLATLAFVLITRG